MKKLVTALLISLTMLLGCSGNADKDKDLLARSYEDIEKSAKGSTVRFYMYGGFAHVNKWIDEWVAPEMQRRYGIKVERVSMDASAFVNKLLAEKNAKKTDGSIDLLWINGENFRNARKAGLLFGPFADRLPNFKAYADANAASQDFGFPTDGYEAPYGQAQFVFEYDSVKIPYPPKTMSDLADWAKAHPGRFTYPQPPDFTGSAFIRQALYAVTGGHPQYMSGFNQTLFDRTSPSLWSWLNDLKPDLWQSGRSYPKDSSTLDTLFARGEVDFNMSYHPLHAQSKILDGSYKPTVRTFVLADGSIYNLHFTAIPFNAPNKAGAMVLANFLMSPEAQLSKYDPLNWGDFPAIDLGRLTPEQRDAFTRVDLGPATLMPKDLAAVAVPEIPADYLEALEKGWDANVLSK